MMTATTGGVTTPGSTPDTGGPTTPTTAGRATTTAGGEAGRGWRRVLTDDCREICDWEAELVCPLRVDSRRIVWTREHDAYYPRDKYRDILHYCAGRCDPEGDVLRIRKVKPEDKGVYRCYIEGGDERDFKVVQFQPKFPLELNSNGIDC